MIPWQIFFWNWREIKATIMENTSQKWNPQIFKAILKPFHISWSKATFYTSPSNHNKKRVSSFNNQSQKKISNSTVNYNRLIVKDYITSYIITYKYSNIISCGLHISAASPAFPYYSLNFHLFPWTSQIPISHTIVKKALTLFLFPTKTSPISLPHSLQY